MALRAPINVAASIPSGLPQVTITTAPPDFATRFACASAASGFAAY